MFLENRFVKSILLGNRFSIKVNFENRFLKIIDIGEGLVDFYRIQRFRLNDQCLPKVFLKILKLFSRNQKNLNSFEIKNNLIVIYI
jgi:hypothetical protein